MVYLFRSLLAPFELKVEMIGGMYPPRGVVSVFLVRNERRVPGKGQGGDSLISIVPMRKRVCAGRDGVVAEEEGRQGITRGFPLPHICFQPLLFSSSIAAPCDSLCPSLPNLTR